MAPEVYSINELVELYGERWQVEVDYRYIKTTLNMEEFDVKTAEMFRKELAAGLLTYNCICALMTKAAIKAGIKPNKLSFSCCWRRVRDIWLQGVPQWVITENKLEDWLMTRLAKCRLSHQQNKVKHEPRKVRRRPQVFPALKRSRDLARKQVAIGDFHQMVSYAKATKCYEAVLVYPKPLCFPLDAKNDDIRFFRNGVRSLTFSLDGNLNDAGNTFLQDLQRRR
ncbi:MAG: hypothetical protein GDA56_09480 [Hormoscilla sp. GM7CHS1pb]|nr:hypothetical protein [Hormoscilla sp. GM7CHS1pb]